MGGVLASEELADRYCVISPPEPEPAPAPIVLLVVEIEAASSDFSPPTMSPRSPFVPFPFMPFAAGGVLGLGVAALAASEPSKELAVVEADDPLRPQSILSVERINLGGLGNEKTEDPDVAPSVAGAGP